MILMRRSSISSSGETEMSVCVSIWPSLRRNSTRGSVKVASYDIGRAQRRLVASSTRPCRHRHRARSRTVPQLIARAVFAPARHCEVVPAAVAAARIRQHDVIAAVREHLHGRRRRVAGVVNAYRRLRLFPCVRARRPFPRVPKSTAVTRGTRSCNRCRLAWNSGTDVKRRCIGCSSSAWPSASSLMP